MKTVNCLKHPEVFGVYVRVAPSLERGSGVIVNTGSDNETEKMSEEDGFQEAGGEKGGRKREREREQVQIDK